MLKNNFLENLRQFVSLRYRRNKYLIDQILGEVTIVKGSIAIVSVLSYSVAVENPAKVIKKRE